MAHVVTAELHLDPLFLSNILTTAAEGGINYWATFKTRRDSDLNVVEIYRIEDSEDPDTVADLVVTLDDVARGLQLLLDLDTLGSVTLQGILLEIVDPGNYSGCTIDADYADRIVQFALFGEVIYC